MAVLTEGGIRLPAAGLDLAQTLYCGQSFSWRPTGDGGHLGVAAGRCVYAAQRGDALVLHHPDGVALTDDDAQFWWDYFDLGRDYAALHARFGQNEALGRCVAAAPGIRVLRQPFFETLLCFIISQNNHIPRIMGIVARLREGFGPALCAGVHGFPAPQTLAPLHEEDLAMLRAGFRARYLLDAARRVAAGEVTEEKLLALPDAEARKWRTACACFRLGTAAACRWTCG